MTVTGPLPFDRLGVCDAHNHVWIERLEGVDPANPALDQFDSIRQELADYQAAGGAALLDCQPGGCGRDGRRLVDLAVASGVHIIACTGFHRQKYYPPAAAFWSLSPQAAADLFISELSSGLEETRSAPRQVKAGFMKIALEETWAHCPLPFLEAAAAAAANTSCMVEVHTEKGALAEELIGFFEDNGVSSTRVVLCHMDKRPDFSLHAELASTGVMLEYDTFFRAKYAPEDNLWPLLDRMVGDGLGSCVVLATDMAEKESYKSIGGGPGLASLPGSITAHLRERGFSESTIFQLTGGNIARRLAGLN